MASMIKWLMKLMAEDFKLIARLYSFGNALKVYQGTYKALLDPFLLQVKKILKRILENR
jgi:hypothetical protein